MWGEGIDGLGTRQNTSKKVTRPEKDWNDSCPPGIYRGIIRYNNDIHRTGCVGVEITALSKDASKNLYTTCYWSSPFAGSTQSDLVGENIEKEQDSITSYGMWMIPPDIGNYVLVAFADQSEKKGYVLSCLFNDKFTYQVPGNAGGKSFGDPGLNLPVVEKNKRDEKITHNDATRPLNTELAKSIVESGLARDPLRGAGYSTSRRESPSLVYGILTPGPKTAFGKRDSGHSFVMDDGDDSMANAGRLIRIRSGTGNQVLLDDVTGSVYINNRIGTWLELGASGDITAFSHGSINLRAKGNFNLRADKNVSIEAGQDILMKAAGDNKGDKYVGIPALGALGIPPLGNGGDIKFEAAADLSAYAGLNTQLTANGGDVDISAGSRVALTASGPLGMDILAATGPIKIDATVAPITIMAPVSPITIASGSLASVTGGLVLINSGGFPPIPAIPAVAAPQIGTKTHKDQGRERPKFDFEAGREGKSAATTQGEWGGQKADIKTIVSTMPTAEPYSGHFQSDPISESAQAPKPDPDLIKKLPTHAIDFSGKPVDVNTPNGVLQGTGYTDADGNPITDFTKVGGSFKNQLGQTVENVEQMFSDNLSSMSEKLGLGSDIGSALAGGVGDPASLLGGLGGDAAQAALSAAFPQFAGIMGIYNNFQNIMDLNLLDIQGIGALVNGLKAVLPPIRFPTSNALSQKIIGLKKKLDEMEAQLNQFGLDKLGFELDIMGVAMSAMRGDIAGALSAATGSADFEKLLADKGISVFQDGPGTIFEDALGNKLVDFSNGIGPVGATMGVVSDLNKTMSQIQGAIKSPLTNNQTLAITNFAQSVTPEVFRNSNVLSAINEGKTSLEKYAAPARLMQGWVTSPATPGGNPVIQDNLVGQRRYEASLWQCPDGMNIDIGSGYLPGEVNFQQLADELDAARAEYLANGGT